MGNSAREACNEQKGRTIVRNLERRHFDAWYCATKEEACSLALKLIPEGASVSWGGSMTIRDIGLTEALYKGNYRVIDRDEARTEEEKKKAYLDAFDADFYLASVNALSEDGVLVNIDGNGNRVAAMAYGPRRQGRRLERGALPPGRGKRKPGPMIYGAGRLLRKDAGTNQCFPPTSAREYRRPRRTRPRRTRALSGKAYTLNRKSTTSPSCMT